MDEILKIQNISKSYGELSVLKNVNLSVEKGEVVVIVGPSGCGKSTLLRCVIALEEIDDGEVIPGGEVGMVFQSYELFPHKTILQNLTLAPTVVKKADRSETKKEALALLDRVGLLAKKDNYPHQLSGGQRQRVAIVRALMMHPEILLLDEITAALDPEMVREVLEVVLDLAKEGRTMLIVTHELQFARAVADRMVFMDDGVVVEEGSPDEFFDNPRTDRLKTFLHSFSYE